MDTRRMPWLTLGILGSVAALLGGAWTLQFSPWPHPACPMKTYLGIPCATCGLTRCAMALLRGDWAAAFHWHPVALILILLSPLAMAWDLRRIWRREAYPPLPDSLPLRLAAAGLLAGTWLLQILRGI